MSAPSVAPFIRDTCMDTHCERPTGNYIWLKMIAIVRAVFSHCICIFATSVVAFVRCRCGSYLCICHEIVCILLFVVGHIHIVEDCWWTLERCVATIKYWQVMTQLFIPSKLLSRCKWSLSFKYLLIFQFRCAYAFESVRKTSFRRIEKYQIIGSMEGAACLTPIYTAVVSSHSFFRSTEEYLWCM